MYRQLPMTLRIDDFDWISMIVDKIIITHGVHPDDVESALLNDEPKPYAWKKGTRYLALAQVEDDGPYLFIVFAMQPGNVARVITARQMEKDEKARFRKIRNLT
jgi:uncharacterized protein